MPTLNEAKLKFTRYSLRDATTQGQLVAKINEVNNQLGYQSITPTVTSYPAGTAVSTGATGNGNSTVFDHGNGNNNRRNGALVRIVTTVGATPTCTFAIQGSTDNSTWAAVNIADSGTPATFTTNTFVITSATTVVKIVQPGQVYRYLRVVYSANTNVTITTDIYPLGD